MNELFVAPLHWGFVFFGWMALGVFGAVLQLLLNVHRLLGKEGAPVSPLLLAQNCLPIDPSTSSSASKITRRCSSPVNPAISSRFPTRNSVPSSKP